MASRLVQEAIRLANTSFVGAFRFALDTLFVYVDVEATAGSVALVKGI